MVNLQAFTIMTPLATTDANLNRFNPHYLHSYPTFLEMLAHAQLQGELKVEPEFISLGSEPVSRLALQRGQHPPGHRGCGFIRIGGNPARVPAARRGQDHPALTAR